MILITNSTCNPNMQVTFCIDIATVSLKSCLTYTNVFQNDRLLEHISLLNRGKWSAVESNTRKSTFEDTGSQTDSLHLDTGMLDNQHRIADASSTFNNVLGDKSQSLPRRRGRPSKKVISNYWRGWKKGYLKVEKIVENFVIVLRASPQVII